MRLLSPSPAEFLLALAHVNIVCSQESTKSRQNDLARTGNPRSSNRLRVLDYAAHPSLHLRPPTLPLEKAPPHSQCLNIEKELLACFTEVAIIVIAVSLHLRPSPRICLDS